MECGIVGLPNVGKSTLFNALTAAGIEAANYPFCTIEPNVGIVEVPDPRLARIEAKIPTQKVIPAAVRLVDIAGIVKGASEGEGLGNKFLSHIREVDAILHVVRCFEDADITHVDGSVDPVRDADVIETELILADLSVCENGVDKARRQARTGDKEWAARLELLQRCQAHLEAAQPIRGMELTEDEERTLRGYGFITAKRVIFIANVDESGLAEDSPPAAALRDHANNTGAGMVKVCAKIESELAELDDETKAEMLADLGMDEPALHKVTRAAYALLGLQSYFTPERRKSGPGPFRSEPPPPKPPASSTPILNAASSVPNVSVWTTSNAMTTRRAFEKPASSEARGKLTWWPMATSSTSSSMSEDPIARHPMHPL